MGWYLVRQDTFKRKTILPFGKDMDTSIWTPSCLRGRIQVWIAALYLEYRLSKHIYDATSQFHLSLSICDSVESSSRRAHFGGLALSGLGATDRHGRPPQPSLALYAVCFDRSIFRIIFRIARITINAAWDALLLIFGEGACFGGTYINRICNFGVNLFIRGGAPVRTVEHSPAFCGRCGASMGTAENLCVHRVLNVASLVRQRTHIRQLPIFLHFKLSSISQSPFPSDWIF